MITQQLLHERFDYHPDGYLTYKYNVARCKKGDRVGWISNTGYMMTKIKGKQSSIHRLIYMYHHGDILYEIDHINNDKVDNRIENLRDVPHSINQKNTTPQKNRGGIQTTSIGGKRRYTDYGKKILRDYAREMRKKTKGL